MAVPITGGHMENYPLNAIQVTELAVNVCKFVRTPKHFIDVADFLRMQLAEHDLSQVMVERMILVTIMDGLRKGTFILSKDGRLLLDPYTNAMTDEELEEARVSAVAAYLLDELDQT
jgi:hypothetical protein